MSRPALDWLSAALFASILPLFLYITPWVPLVFSVSIFASLAWHRRGTRLRSAPLKLLLLALVAAAVMVTYDSLSGLESGVSLLVLLVALKRLEAHTRRDFQVLVMLGVNLCLASLFFSQNLLSCLYALAVFILLGASLISFHQGPDSGGRSWAVARTSLLLIAQAAPLVAVLFLFFPRLYTGFRFQLGPSLINRTGMSDGISPGSVAEVAESDAIAFRVDFPDGGIPPQSELYWRGAVLWRGEGLSWVRGARASVGSEERLGGELVRQRIVLQPHGERWMFALHYPASAEKGATLEPGGLLRSDRPIYSLRRYEVYSRSENREENLDRGTQILAMQLPRDLDPRVQELAQQWRAAGGTDEAVVERALQYFKRSGFVYTLSPGNYSGDALAGFLFQRRRGFCEHFAGAFATLMRAARIPTRVVVGYQGGQLNTNRLGNYVIVRQSDAHAWCEVWMQGKGWERVDPTTVVAPGRVTLGAQSFLESGAGTTLGNPLLTESAGATGVRELLREMRLAWDSVNYQWDLRVLNYDDDAQTSLLASLGLESPTRGRLLAWSAIGVLAGVGLLALVVRLSTRLPQPGILIMAWRDFGHRMAKVGVPRQPSDGPLDFGERAAAMLPDDAATIRDLCAEYAALRYAPTRSTRAEVERWVHRIRKLPGGARIASQAGTAPLATG